MLSGQSAVPRILPGPGNALRHPASAVRVVVSPGWSGNTRSWQSSEITVEAWKLSRTHRFRTFGHRPPMSCKMDVAAP